MSDFAVESPCPTCREETVFEQDDIAEDGRTVTCGHCGAAFPLSEKALSMFDLFADMPSLDGMFRPLQPGEKQQTEEEFLDALEKATKKGIEDAGFTVEKVERKRQDSDGEG